LRWKILAVLTAALSASGAIQAQKWERLGPEGGMVVSLGTTGAGPVYLGAADGHVFASGDSGENWELRGRVGQRLDAVVTRLVVDPRDGQRVFASVWYQRADGGGGVFESADGGRNWRLLGLGTEAVRALEIAPSEPNELVAGTRSGVFLSRDSGKTWSRISPEGDPELKNLDSLAIDPRDPQVIYAGTYHLPWLTQDGGKTWKPIIAGIIDDSDIMSLRLDATNPDRVYMSACSGIYRSENQGGQWTKLQGIPYAARRTQTIVQDPGSPKTFYAGTTAGLWVTRDSGENWALTTSKEWVVNALVVLKNNGAAGRVVLGTEQGLEISDDGGVTFREADRGFTHSAVKRLVVDRRDARHLLMAVEANDAKLRESSDFGKTWSAVSLEALAHGQSSALNADEIARVLASPWGWMVRLQNGKFWLLADGAKSWREWSPLLPEAMKRPAPTANPRVTKSESMTTLKIGAAIAFSESEAVLSTNLGVLRCALSGRCTRMKAFESKSQVREVASGATGESIAVAMDGKFGWSDDGGQTAVWRDLPVPMEEVVWVDLAEGDKNAAIYLGSSRGLFASNDAGASWQRIESGLPAGPVEQWLRGVGLWAVSEEGGSFYVSKDRGATWQRADRDAERSIFSGFAALPEGGVLAGSESEGLLRFELK